MNATGQLQETDAARLAIIQLLLFLDVTRVKVLHVVASDLYCSQLREDELEDELFERSLNQEEAEPCMQG